MSLPTAATEAAQIRGGSSDRVTRISSKQRGRRTRCHACNARRWLSESTPRTHVEYRHAAAFPRARSPPPTHTAGSMTNEILSNDTWFQSPVAKLIALIAYIEKKNTHESLPWKT